MQKLKNSESKIYFGEGTFELRKLIIASKKKIFRFFVNCFNLANNIGFSGLGNSIGFLSLDNDLGFSGLGKVLFKGSKDHLTKRKF